MYVSWFNGLYLINHACVCINIINDWPMETVSIMFGTIMRLIQTKPLSNNALLIK